MVAGKAAHLRTVIQRGPRDHRLGMPADQAATLDAAEHRFVNIARRTMPGASTDTLCGLEGEAALVCFGCFDAMLRIERDAFRYRRRLRRVARACLDDGQAMQDAVFGSEVEPALWTALRVRLVAEIDPAIDHLRLYPLCADGRGRVEHVGAKPALDLDDPLPL